MKSRLQLFLATTTFIILVIIGIITLFGHVIPNQGVTMMPYLDNLPVSYGPDLMV